MKDETVAALDNLGPMSDYTRTKWAHRLGTPTDDEFMSEWAAEDWEVSAKPMPEASPLVHAEERAADIRQHGIDLARGA